MAAFQQPRISKRKLERAKQQVFFHEVSDAAVNDPLIWKRFDFQQPAYVTNARIGPCLIHGVGASDSNRDQYLIYPVSVLTSSLKNTGGIGRDKWYSVPRMVSPFDNDRRYDYVLTLDALIIAVTIVEGDTIVGKSRFTIDKVTHNLEQRDTAEVITMTLDELQTEIIDRQNDDYKRALDVFMQSNPSLTKRIDFMAKHKTSPEADQLIIGELMTDTEIDDRYALVPDFLQKYFRVKEK